MPDAVPNKFLKLSVVATVVALDEEEGNIVNPDHDYCQNQVNANTINNNNSAQANPTINSSIVNSEHDYGQNQVNTSTINDINNNSAQDNPSINNSKVNHDLDQTNMDKDTPSINVVNPDHDYCYTKNITNAANNANNNNYTANHTRTVQNCEEAIMHYLALKQENQKLKKEIKFLKTKKHENSIVFKHLHGKTNPATAAMLVTGGRGKKLYSREDVAVAAVLKNMSCKTYKFLRKKKLLKLPSESTLGEWLRNFTLDTNGLQHNLLDILSAKSLSAADRELWLSFDEMALRESYLYDPKTKKVLLPAKKLQCVMVRSLISGFKLPIYFSTNENMTVEILSEITRALEARGFTVRGASFDLGNKGFMSQTNFNKGKYYIPHPVDPRRRFYLLPDPPHLIKLLRNHVFSKVKYF